MRTMQTKVLIIVAVVVAALVLHYFAGADVAHWLHGGAAAH